jgi:hypothetical protein
LLLSLFERMIERVDDGAERSTRVVVAPVVGWASGPLGVVQVADREIARATAVRARAVAAFAASRPAEVDRAQGERGAMSAERWAARADVLRPVSEWATPELAIALNLTQQGAEGLLAESLTLVHRLPATLAALEAGVLHRGHLWHLIDKVAPIEHPGLRAEIEADLLAWMGRRQTVTSPAQLGDKARVLVAKRDATAAARRLARALTERGISLHPERTEGMACLSVVCTMPEARALYAALVQCAEALVDDPDGPPRTRGQKMVDALLDLVLRPGETDLPPMQVLLTIVASIGTLLGGDDPGEVDGELVPAAMVRQLVRALAGRGLPPAADDPTTDAVEVADVNVAEVAATRGSTALPAVAASAAANGRAGVSWQEAEQAELGAWWDELEARLLAGELPGEPDWGPDPTPAERVEQQFDGPQPWGDPGDPDWLTDPTLRPPWTDDGPPDPGVAPSNTVPRPGTDSPSDRGWWAAADRAIDDAGAAVHAARLALGHAQRSVRTAVKAAAAAEAAWRESPAGRVDAADDALGALAAAADVQRAKLADLLAATAGGGLADRPRIVLTDAITGAMRALTDLPGLRRAAHCGTRACRRRPETCGHDLTHRLGLRAPDPTGGYTPGAALDRHSRARDRRCRFPGCRRRVPRAGELDHHRPHSEGGATAAANLAGYCTGDHRGKHQAPGWQHHLAPDGTLTVTTPTGLTTATTPPPY